VIRGGNGNDAIWGRGGNDRLVGQNGNDRLFGQAGDDRLFGQGGNDRLFGGPGIDLFVIAAGDAGTDHVLDFAQGEKLQFRGFTASKADIVADAEVRAGKTFIDVDDDGADEVVLHGFTTFDTDSIV
jgi:Ca2+-binding RTX toxin-like protein